MSDESGENRIGQLNGKWSILFRATLAIIAFIGPFAIAFSIWLVSTIHNIQTDLERFIAVGPRYTTQMAQADTLRLKSDILTTIKAEYPPKWLLDSMATQAQKLGQIESKLYEIEKSVTDLQRKNPNP